MPTVFQFLQNPQLFPYQSTLSNHPDVLNSLIDYISKNPNPLLNNDQQCFVYPNRSADILSLGTTYRAIIAKRQRKNKKNNQTQFYYPVLDRLFKNLQAISNQIQDSLLGYTNKVLISLAKKTPEIYQFIKDNQQVISLLVKNNRFLKNFKQFWVIFLIQSTMGLYSFLKNVVTRTIMFRIIDQKDVDNLIAYQTLLAIYSQITKKLKSKLIPQDQRQQLQEICVNFHDQDFVTLLILKISNKSPHKTFYIGKILNQIINSSQSKPFSSITISHIQAIQQYFESYQQSSNFMQTVSADQIEILKLLLNLSQKDILEYQFQANLLKRLLVYTSIHKQNSILHSILFSLIEIITLSGDKQISKDSQSCEEQQKKDSTQQLQNMQKIQQKEELMRQKKTKQKIFSQINVISFLMKNIQVSNSKYSYSSLVWKICQHWECNKQKLYQYLNQQERTFVKQQFDKKNKKVIESKFYKQLQNSSEIITSRSQSTQNINLKQLQNSDKKQDKIIQ